MPFQEGSTAAPGLGRPSGDPLKDERGERERRSEGGKQTGMQGKQTFIEVKQEEEGVVLFLSFS